MRRAYRLLIGIAVVLSSTISSEIRAETKGRLGAYYIRTEDFDITDFNIAYTRLVIPWQAIETQEGKFSWDAQPIRWIERSLAKGIKVIPVIRSIGAGGCSSAPRDLQASFNAGYGFSKSYYNFISEVAKHFKGKFPIVVIENEVTAKNFWCGSMDEYLRLVATAKKAFKDIDPDVKIADSGIPSTVWGFLMTKELLDQGKEKQAFDFYCAYFRQSFIRKANSAQELKIMLERNPVRENIKNAEYLLQRLQGAVDVVNFHYYEPAELLPDVVSFIRRKTGNKPLINNELGVRCRMDEPEREKKAAEDMVKKLSLCRKLNLEAAIWYPFSNDRHNIVGLLDEDKRKISATINAFAAAMNSDL